MMLMMRRRRRLFAMFAQQAWVCCSSVSNALIHSREENEMQITFGNATKQKRRKILHRQKRMADQFLFLHLYVVATFFIHAAINNCLISIFSSFCTKVERLPKRVRPWVLWIFLRLAQLLTGKWTYLRAICGREDIQEFFRLHFPVWRFASRHNSGKHRKGTISRLN